jgi:hypothetical protein
MLAAQRLTASALQNTVLQTLPNGQLELTAHTHRITMSCRAGAHLRRLPTDAPSAQLELSVSKSQAVTEAYFLVGSAARLSDLEVNGRRLGGGRPGALVPRRDWGEDDFQAFLVFAETQARMWLVSGSTDAGAHARVQTIATWCTQLHALASARAKEHSDCVHPSTRERVAALARTLRAAKSSLLQSVGQLGNLDKLSSIRSMNADQKATFVQSRIASVALAKRATKHVDYSATGGVNGLARSGLQSLAAGLMTLRTPEPEDAATSFYSMESYRQALIEGVTTLMPLLDKHADAVSAADILRVVGGLGLAFRGTAGSFVDPWAFRVARVYLGMYVSEQDVRSTTVLTDPTRMPDAADVHDSSGDGTDSDTAGAGAGAGGAAAGAVTGAANCRRVDRLVDPLSRNTYLMFPGATRGIITGVLPLEALDPEAHDLYRQTGIAELQASVSCRAIMAPLASDRFAMAAAVQLAIVTAVGGHRAPTALERETLAMVRMQLAGHFRIALGTAPMLSPFTAICNHLAAHDPARYMTGDEISDVLKVYAALLAAPQCEAFARTPAATHAATSATLATAATGGSTTQLQAVVGACAWLLVYRAARKHFKTTDAAAAAASATAGATPPSAAAPAGVSFAPSAPSALLSTNTALTRTQTLQLLVGWDAAADAARHPVGEPLTPTQGFIEPDESYIAAAFAQIASALHQVCEGTADSALAWIPCLETSDLAPVARFAAFPNGAEPMALSDALGYKDCSEVVIGDGHAAASTVVLAALVLRAVQCDDESKWVNKTSRETIAVPTPSNPEACAALVRGVIVELSRSAYGDRVREKERLEAAIRLQTITREMLQCADMDLFVARLCDTFANRSAPGYAELERRLLQAASSPCRTADGEQEATALPLAKLVVIATGNWFVVEDAVRVLKPLWCAGNRHPSEAFVSTLADLLEADDPSGEQWADFATLLERRTHTYRRTNSGLASANRHGHSAEFPSYYALGYRTAQLMKRDAPELWEEYRRNHVACCTRGADVVAARPGKT